MIAERNLIVSILKLTKDGKALRKDIEMDARLPSDFVKKLLEKLREEEIIRRTDSLIEVKDEGRLRLAIKAVSSGADVEAVTRLLRWQEFETIAATALQNHGYDVMQNLRFKQAARRWEIDVVGCKKPLVICVDCKSWHRGAAPSTLKRVVEAQEERTLALMNALPNNSMTLACDDWNRAKFIPVVLVLISSRIKFYNGVPVVSVLQLQDFLNQLPLELDSLKFFQKEFAHLSHDFEQRRSAKS